MTNLHGGDKSGTFEARATQLVSCVRSFAFTLRSAFGFAFTLRSAFGLWPAWSLLGCWWWWWCCCWHRSGLALTPKAVPVPQPVDDELL